MIARVVDEGTREIARQEVGRELNAAEIGVNDLCQGAGGQRLRHPGNAFKEDVAIAEQGEEQAVDEGFLPDHDLTDAFTDLVQLGAVFVDERSGFWVFARRHGFENSLNPETDCCAQIS